MKFFSSRFVSAFASLLVIGFASRASAEDSTPPTLTVSHTWMEKIGSKFRFNLLLDPRDNVGIERLEFREKINTTSIPANTAWREAFQNGEAVGGVPWKPHEPLTLDFNCTSLVLQVRAVDAAGNYSAVVTRTYKSPFPLSGAPNLTPAFGSSPISFSGSPVDCRGLFTADFDGNGRDDIVSFDRTTGTVHIRLQSLDGQFTDAGFNLSADTITDAAVADFDGDGKPDIAVVASGAVSVYCNGGMTDGVLMFSNLALGDNSATGMASIEHVVAGDVTGDGQPDLIISGTGDGGIGGSGANVAVLINNAQFTLNSATNAIAPSGASAGRLALGDFNGDGWPDVAMIDAAQKRVIIFENKQDGTLGAADDANTDLRPRLLRTGLGYGTFASQPLQFPDPAKAFAVGDVTGDGRPDIVFTVHNFHGGSGNAPDFRNRQYWQLLENRGAAGFYRAANGLISQSEPADVPADYPSDVLIQDINQHGLPEMIFTGQFLNGIKAVRLMPLLNRQNEMKDFAVSDVNIGQAASLSGNPHRLTAARFGANSKKDIIVANGASTPLNWWFTTSNLSTTKPIDIFGGANTSTDFNGTRGHNYVYDYTAFVGGTINYSLNFINNTDAAVENATLECLLPPGLSVVSGSEGYTTAASGTSTYIRWTETLEAKSTGVKSFVVRVNTVVTNTILAPKIYIKRDTKITADNVLPNVQILPANFTVEPNSPEQPWVFIYKPVSAPPLNSTLFVETSSDGTNWSVLMGDTMARISSTALEWRLSAVNVPGTSRYFRAVIYADGRTFGYSSSFKNELPATTALKITTKKPEKSNQTWTFAATQTSKAPNLIVRFQSTATPEDGNSWTDLPAYAPTLRKGDVWTSVTYNIPSGPRYFRAVSYAPGWGESASAASVAYVVGPAPEALPPFTQWHIDYEHPARVGEPVTFSATIVAAPGLRVRFQSKLDSDPSEDAWRDLTNGTTKVAGAKWTFATKLLPEGFRDFRAVASAPGFEDSSQWLDKGELKTAIFAFNVQPRPFPQIDTIFAGFASPEDGGVKRTDIPFNVQISILDLNEIQRVYLEYATTSAGPFKALPGDMNSLGDFLYSKSVTFTGTGPLFLRAVVIDKFIPAATCRSVPVGLNIGPGSGSINGPYAVGTFVNQKTQATLKARGSVKLKLKIGDDRQVFKAILKRTNSSGGIIGEAGEMIRASTANPSDFNFVDANLSDGTYYYSVVARDYDGNENTFPCPTAYEILTPAPPPAPVNLDIAVASRVVGPTVPTTKYNYSYLPYPSQGMIDFTYSNLPAGTSRFVAYRTDLGPDRPYWEQTVTKTSGVMKIKAPFWTKDKTNPNAGEGTYRITVFNGSYEIAHGSGVDTFRVGHAWNLPSTFTTLDFGLYWFKDGKNALLGVAGQDDDYFDPDKPTVIYVHGWQPGEVAAKRRECWVRQDSYSDSVSYDMCKTWKDQGYNVGMFNWNQFADGDLLFSQANIYYIATENGLPDGHSLVYSKLDSSGKSGRHYLPYEKSGTIQSKTVCDIFIMELQRCLGDYTPSSNKELRFVGHSLGTQVVGRTSWMIQQNPGLGAPLPTRISLLELAQINGLSHLPPPYNNTSIPDMQKQFITDLKDDGIAIDCYQSTDLQSFLGVNLAFVGDVHDMCAYARVRPDFIAPLDVFLGVFQKSHNEIVHWYMDSFGYNELPAYYYTGGLFSRRDNAGKGLSATTSNSRVRSMMGQNVWFEQSEGKNTATITDDGFDKRFR